MLAEQLTITYGRIVLISQQLGRVLCIVLVKLPGPVVKALIQQPAKSIDSTLHVLRAHRRKGHTLGSNRKTGAAAVRAAASLAASLADADLGLAVLPAGGTGGVAGAVWLFSSQSTCRSNLPQLFMCSRVQCSGWPPSLHHPHKGLQLTVHVQKLSCTVYNGRVQCDAILRRASSSQFHQDSALTYCHAKHAVLPDSLILSSMCYACSCRSSWLMKLTAYHL